MLQTADDDDNEQETINRDTLKSHLETLKSARYYQIYIKERPLKKEQEHKLKII